MKNIIIFIIGLLLIVFGIILFKQKTTNNLDENLFTQTKKNSKKKTNKDSKLSLFDQIVSGNFEDDKENKR